MPPALPLHFGSYRLEGPQGPLWHHAELTALPLYRQIQSSHLVLIG
jgi:hypothetical protein